MSLRYDIYDRDVLYLFNQVLDVRDRFVNCQYIHPTKQKALAETIKAASRDPNVEYLAVFGSVITERCWEGSDIDLVVWDKTHKFKPPFNSAYDVFYADELNASWAVYDDICNKGIVVYARSDTRDFQIIFD